MNIQNNIIKKVISYFLIFTTFFASISPTFAVSNAQDLMIRGDVTITKNELGNIILNIPPGETSEQLFALAGTAPIIWGRYYQNDASGTIQASYLQKNIQTGGVLLITELLTPSMMQRFGDGNGIVSDFQGANPAGNFIGPNGTYKGITFQAFASLAGMWAKNKSATKGFLVSGHSDYHGVYKWDQCIKKIMRACVRKRFHQEAYSMITPTWYVMAPAEVGVGHNTDPIYFTSDTCKNAGGSTIDCQVRAGMSFIPVTNSGNDFPHTPEKMWHHHEHKDGWAAWLTMAIAFVLTGDPGFALSRGVMTYAVTGAGPDDYLDGSLNIVDGKGTSGSLGPWSPIGCESGQSSSSGGSGGGRYGHNECYSFTTSNISTTHAGVGNFYNQKVQNPTFDYSTSNDVQVLRNSSEPPVRVGGAPPRF